MFVLDEIYENIILSLDVLIIFFTVEKKLQGKQLSYHTTPKLLFSEVMFI